MSLLSNTMKGTVDLSGHWGQIMYAGVNTGGSLVWFSTRLSDTVKALWLVSFLYLPALLFILCSSCGLYLLTPVRPTILVLSHVAACFFFFFFFFRKTLRTQRAQTDKQAATVLISSPLISVPIVRKKEHDIGWKRAKWRLPQQGDRPIWVQCQAGKMKGSCDG